MVLIGFDDLWTKQFKNGAFQKRWRHDSREISLKEFCSNTDAKMKVDCCVFKSLWRSVDLTRACQKWEARENM